MRFLEIGAGTNPISGVLKGLVGRVEQGDGKSSLLSTSDAGRGGRQGFKPERRTYGSIASDARAPTTRTANDEDRTWKYCNIRWR